MNFQFNHKQTNTYCWVRIGKRWHIQQNPQGFRMSFIVACQKISCMDSKGRFEQSTQLLL